MKNRLLYTLLPFFLLFISPFFLHAQSGQYLHFDGDDDYVKLDSASVYIDGSSEVTMAAWFYTDELIYGSGMMGFRGGGTGDDMYLIQLSNGIVECRMVNGSGFHEVVGPAGTIEAGVWQHVAWVFDGSSVELFVDGVSIGSDPASGSFNSDDKVFGIGKNILAGYNFVFKGRIDELSLWSKGLTQTEIEDMMDNELNGDEEDLQLYYKFNQGIPGGDNTAISELVSEVGDGERNASLENFALTGETSNFGGELDTNVQVISFPSIPNKLITDQPFELEAYSSSGLPITYSIVSGPATVSGDTVTLDGQEGEVLVMASQEGNGAIDPAEDVISSFHVLDPETNLANIELTNPTSGDVLVPELGAIPLSAIADIDFPELFWIDELSITIDGDIIVLEDHQNGHFTGWWTPQAYGEYTFEVSASNNFGAAITENYTINVVDTTYDQEVAAATDVWIYSDVYSQEVEVTLPSYMGAYDQIIGSLEINCPAGGCDPWDRVSHVEIKGHDGEWYEIIRYLTPYGVACDHEIDLTDFMSLLQGKITIRFTLGTSGNGFLYTLNLDYQSGSPDYNYTSITKLWNKTYAFGDLADLQPCEIFNIDYDQNVEDARIKMVSTGHGWGDNNTGNAAEFHHDYHHIWLNGTETFEQDNWYDCNPNPDGCSPQNGTWYFDRAGWCPGSIAQFFDFDLEGESFESPMELKYIFDEDYVDYCHPNNEDCVSGVTCDNCDDGFNPHLIVASYLVSYSNVPLGENGVTLDVEELEVERESIQFDLFPNPSFGQFSVRVDARSEVEVISIFSLQGELISEIPVLKGQEIYNMNMAGISGGVYIVKLYSQRGIGSKKIIIHQ